MSGMVEDASLGLHSEVTEDHVKEALMVDKGKQVHLLSWATKSFTKKGDNYISVVNCLQVEYVLDQTKSKKSYIIKIIPHHPMKAYRDITHMAFHKEARFYSDLAPELNDELERIGQPPLRIPTCYHTNLETKKEIIILEDLRLLGFRMYDRRKGMDVAHATLVLQELARLHASSLLLQNREGFEDLEAKYDFMTRDWMHLNEQSITFSRELFEGSIDNAMAILNKVGGYNIAIKWLNNLKPQIHEKVEEQLKKCPPFTVICHGDCWNNNTLFRYNEEGHPVEVMLLDLQLMRRASLASDLNYLTYTSLIGPDRRNNIEDFLDTYYATFQSVMAAGGLEVSFTRQELQREYRDKHLWGIISALEIVPIVVGEGSEVPDYSNISEGGMDSFVKKQQDNMLQMIEKNPLLRPRFLAIFDEMMECGVIS